MGVQREGLEFGSSGERSGRSLEVADRLGASKGGGVLRHSHSSII